MKRMRVFAGNWRVQEFGLVLHIAAVMGYCQISVTRKGYGMPWSEGIRCDNDDQRQSNRVM